jgi:hypothetical protein
MRRLFVLALLCAGLASPNADAKVLDITDPNPNQLHNADSFSVECKNNRTGVIARESVDVDAATVTIEVPGNAPEVHHITQWLLDLSDAQDRFGKPGLAVRLRLVYWDTPRKVGLVFARISGGDRWFSNQDGQTWICAN